MDWRSGIPSVSFGGANAATSGCTELPFIWVYVDVVFGVAGMAATVGTEATAFTEVVIEPTPTGIGAATTGDAAVTVVLGILGIGDATLAVFVVDGITTEGYVVCALMGPADGTRTDEPPYVVPTGPADGTRTDEPPYRGSCE